MTSRAAECAVEWDESKNLLNQKKHRVSFEEAATVFRDPLEITISDPDHGSAEHRFISIGESFKQRLLVVSYTERGDRIRIINARTLEKTRASRVRRIIMRREYDFSQGTRGKHAGKRLRIVGDAGLSDRR